MALSYLSPGVFVEEVPSNIRAIAGVSTSTAAFVGVVQDKIHLLARDPANANATKFVDFDVIKSVPTKTPTVITSWAQFTSNFGDLIGDPKTDATKDAAPALDPGQHQLAHAVYGFFNNGGTRCFVVRITGTADMLDALKSLEAIDGISIVCAPGQIDPAIRQQVVDHCEKMKNRFAILDGTGPDSVTDLSRLTTVATTSGTGLAPKNSDFAAWYYPWIRVFDPAEKLAHSGGDGSIAVPPSGHLAGVYARVDSERGVFKAPANVSIRGALDVTHTLSKFDQDLLNPTGVNLIRILNNNLLVWGARTAGGDANGDLRYISTRRTLLFLRGSIEQGTQFAVFEPNTPALWATITRNVSAFLTTVWRAGGLFGATPQEAFFVKCDAETNQPATREIGQVITEVGVAIVRPAEFVIFRISQFQAPTK